MLTRTLKQISMTLALSILAGAPVYAKGPAPLNKSSSLTGDGSNSGGGGNPALNNTAAIRLLIEGEGLKNAMLNYLKTLSLKDVQDEAVKKTLTLITKDALEKDIETAGNYEVMASCRDAYNRNVPASTGIGLVGGKICFDADRLSEQLKSSSEEEKLIQLASLAFHEHVHHFQSVHKNIEDNESEAYQVSAYVLITAKIMQIPLLKWSMPVAQAACPDLRGTWDCDGDTTLSGRQIWVNSDESDYFFHSASLPFGSLSANKNGFLRKYPFDANPGMPYMQVTGRCDNDGKFKVTLSENGMPANAERFTFTRVGAMLQVEYQETIVGNRPGDYENAIVGDTRSLNFSCKEAPSTPLRH